MAKSEQIPKAAITRLSIYYRQLELMEFDGYRMVSSEKLAWLCQVNPAQVRKDLAYFGEFGIRGMGYDVIALQKEIKRILAINRDWNLGIAGIGNMGSALMEHQNFPARGFRCVAAFDNDPQKIGNTTPSGITVRDVRDLNQVAEELNIEIGVITTPPSSAQSVAERFLDAHVNAILNFSPARILVPDCCLVENIDFTVRLDIIAYKLQNQEGFRE
ncbi:MAG: redox-sensing transcriptional repressor Rex [Deltaproteobacteria bacterium]|nr:redox-sensing transcriptional repressor Rex [Deltaproteobacteria bacterium]